MTTDPPMSLPHLAVPPGAHVVLGVSAAAVGQVEGVQVLLGGGCQAHLAEVVVVVARRRGRTDPCVQTDRRWLCEKTNYLFDVW